MAPEAPPQDVASQSKIKAQQQKIARTVLLIFGLHMSSLMITIDSKMMVYLNAFKNTAQVVNTNAKGMTLMLGSSLFLTPVMAAYSQASGRWPLFLIGGLSHVVMQLANLIFPIPQVVLFTTSAGAICNVTMMGAMVAIQDIFAGDPHGAGAAMAFVQAGQLIAATFSPMLGASLAIKNVRLPMAISVVLSSIEVLLLRSLPETLDKAKMRPMSLGGIHPFAFLKVFLRGPRLAALTLVYLITEMTDPLVQNRTASMAHLESLGWNMADCGRYTTASSMVSVPGFLKANQVGKALGTVPALALSGICIALHHFLEGTWVTKAWQQLALLPLLLPRGSTMASIKGLLVETGTAAGFNAGEMQGFISSLKYLAGFLGFPVWAALYARALRNKTPRNFFVSLSAAVFAQMLAGQLAAALSQPKKSEKIG